MTKDSPSEGELIKLIEELKLRQIDLETQNREITKQILRYNLTPLTNIENESKLFTLADNFPGYIAFVNAKTLKYEYVNKAYQNSFGIPIEEIIGKHVREVIGEPNFQFALKYIEMVRAGKSASYENTFNMVSGKRWIRVNYAPDFDKDGNVSSIIALTYDITERKLTSEILRKNDERLRKTQEIAHLGSWDLDINSGQLIWSDEVYTIFGVDTNEFGGTLEAFFDMVHPEDRDSINSAYFSSVEANAPGYMIEHRIIRKNTGEIRYVFEKCEHIRDEKWQIISSLGMVQDITDRKKAEQILIENETKLLQLNAEKDKFFSIIAHDLRSPFNVFLGFTLKMVEELDTMPIKDLQKITLSMRNSATNLFQLLENLLDWSRFQRGLISFDQELLLLKPKITGIIQLALDSANKKGVTIDISIPEDIVIFADRNMLGSIVRNLTSNAVKFTPRGGKILIEARLVKENSTEISVKDTGMGMNKNILEHLFMLNEKASRRGTEGEPSTGLGLIICKDFVEKHSGKIWAVSEEGKGSTFTFTLPSSDISG
jgi:PAS domain S-box-containing protein